MFHGFSVFEHDFEDVGGINDWGLRVVLIVLHQPYELVLRSSIRAKFDEILKIRIIGLVLH